MIFSSLSMQSKVNLELKHLCGDFRSIRSVLRRMGAKNIVTKKQKDYFFNLPSNVRSKIPERLKLREENGRRTLVFYRRPDFSSTTGTPADVLLLPVRDSKLFLFLSKVLGVKVIVEKQRELWRKGNAIFNLDAVKGVGHVFEIEIWTRPYSAKRDQRNFLEYRRKFLPYLGKVVKGSNEDLVLKSRK